MSIRNTVVASTIFVIAVCVGVAMWVDAQDAAIAEPESHVTAELLTQIRTARAEAARQRMRADRSGARVEYHTQLLIIDTTSPAAAVSVLPNDTTRMDWVARAGGGPRYPVPTFFVKAYYDTRQAYVDEHALRVYHETYSIPLGQQLADSLAVDRRDANSRADRAARRARANLVKGGVIGGVIGLVAHAALHG